MTILHDLRFAFRQLTKAPGFTTVAVLTLTLGIGACTAIFSVVNGVLLRPLPFPEPERVVVLREVFRPGGEEFPLTTGRYFAWRKEARAFESLGGLRSIGFNLSGRGEPLRVAGMQMSASTLPTFRLAPQLGRNFSAAEETAGRDGVAILSHGLWQRHFGGRPDVLGERVQLTGRSVTIVGVMPRASPFPESWDIFVPFVPTAAVLRDLEGGSVQAFGRLAPGVTIAQAQDEMARIADRFARENPASRGWSVKLYPVLETAVGQVRPVLLSLLGAVGCLLLIACANVASLLLARASARAREMAVRVAMGASRPRLVRQLLIESLLLALLGGALGALLAEDGLRALLALAPQALPRAAEIAIDARALAFALALALATGVGFGLAPAFQSSRVALHDTLKENGRGASASPRRSRLRSALVAGEVAIALVLLAGAGLLMRSFVRLQAVSPGFQPAGVLTAQVALPRTKYLGDAQYAAFARQTLALLEQVRGVEAVAATRALAFTDFSTIRPFAVAGRPDMRDEKMPLARRYSVSRDFFRAMGIPLLRGRRFEPADEARPGAIIVNEHIARRYFPGQDPLGKRLRFSEGPGGLREIVGVVGDVKPGSLEAGSLPEIYQPFAVAPDNDLFFIVRASQPLPGLPAAIRAAVASVDPEQAVSAIRPLGSWVEATMARQRFALTLFLVFSGVALLLAGIGIYGLMAYSVGQRTGEIGIRIALGARDGDVLRLVLVQGARLVGAGALAGLAGALLLTQLLQKLLFQVSPQDPLTLAAVVLLLALTAGAACLLPARRAMRVNPMSALRVE